MFRLSYTTQKVNIYIFSHTIQLFPWRDLTEWFMHNFPGPCLYFAAGQRLETSQLFVKYTAAVLFFIQVIVVFSMLVVAYGLIFFLLLGDEVRNFCSTFF